jgi:hypothetical protein
MNHLQEEVVLLVMVFAVLSLIEHWYRLFPIIYSLIVHSPCFAGLLQ